MTYTSETNQTVKAEQTYIKAEDGTFFCFVCGVQMEKKTHKFKGPGWRCPDCGRFVAE